MARGSRARARKPGERPPDLTDDVMASLEADLALGLSWADSCRRAGVGESTIHRWRQQGEAEGGELGELVDRLAKAKLSWKRYNLARIASAARGGEETTKRVTKYDRDGNVTETVETTTTHASSWQAAAWILERLSPAEFAKVSRLDISGDEQDARPGEGSAADVATVVSLLDRIAEKQSAG